MRYKVQRGQVTVTGAETTVAFTKIDGTIQFDPDSAASARAELTVDLRVFETTDAVMSWKLKTELERDAEAPPTATFMLARFDDIHEPTAGQWRGVARGQIQFRNASPTVKIKGTATIDRRSLEAQGNFTLGGGDLDAVKEPVSVQLRFFAFAVVDK